MPGVGEEDAASAAADGIVVGDGGHGNHNNQNVNTTNDEVEEEEGQQILVVTTTNSDGGGGGPSVQVVEGIPDDDDDVQADAAQLVAEETVVGGDDRTVIVHEDVLKQSHHPGKIMLDLKEAMAKSGFSLDEILEEVVEFEPDNGMSSAEISDAVASVLPGAGDTQQQQHHGVGTADGHVDMMEFVEEQVVTAEQVVAGEEVSVAAEEEVISGGGDGGKVVVDGQEEVVISGADGEQVVFVTSSGQVVDGQHAGGAGGEMGGDFFVQDAGDGVNGGDVIQMQEEEIIETPSSETEMSVAMEMAKLSQGERGAIYTSPNGTIYQAADDSYSNGYEYDDASPHSTSVILPPSAAANVSSTTSSGRGKGAGRRRSAPATSTTTSTPTGPPAPLGSDGTEKPKMSYAQLIAEALMSSEDRMLPLAEIYQAIFKRHPYYRMEVKSWQNAIRHNLTLNPAFTKIPRPNNEGRGNYWKMEEGAEKTIFRRQIRAAQNRHLLEAKAKANAELRQQRQQARQQQVMTQRRGLIGLGGGGNIQLSSIGTAGTNSSPITYQVVARTGGGQTVVQPTVSNGPTRLIYVRQANAANTTNARPTIQLVNPTRNAGSTIQILNSGTAGVGGTPTIIRTVPVSAAAGGNIITTAPVVSTATAAATAPGPRVMKIKDTIVRQNGSVVFIAMPSNASAIKSTTPVAKPTVQGVVKEETFEGQVAKENGEAEEVEAMQTEDATDAATEEFNSKESQDGGNQQEQQLEEEVVQEEVVTSDQQEVVQEEIVA